MVMMMILLFFLYHFYPYRRWWLPLPTLQRILATVAVVYHNKNNPKLQQPCVIIVLMYYCMTCINNNNNNNNKIIIVFMGQIVLPFRFQNHFDPTRMKNPLPPAVQKHTHYDPPLFDLRNLFYIRSLINLFQSRSTSSIPLRRIIRKTAAVIRRIVILLCQWI